MITAGTYPPIWMDLDPDKPGMTLQCEIRERGYLVWRDYLKDSSWLSHQLILKRCPLVGIGWLSWKQV